ncbi:MAG TPA: hypothetical protein VFG09_01350 [Thermodesulfovibrionales bacterium]|nr:hypothetical protein [Thermodesulfovibrionales bacterium]
MDPERMKEIVEILMESTFYFDLSLEERHYLIRHILAISLTP